MSQFVEDGRQRTQGLQVGGEGPVGIGLAQQADVLPEVRVGVVAAVDDFEKQAAEHGLVRKRRGIGLAQHFRGGSVVGENAPAAGQFLVGLLVGLRGKVAEVTGMARRAVDVAQREAAAAAVLLMIAGHLHEDGPQDAPGLVGIDFLAAQALL